MIWNGGWVSSVFLWENGSEGWQELVHGSVSDRRELWPQVAGQRDQHTVREQLQEGERERSNEWNLEQNLDSTAAAGETLTHISEKKQAWKGFDLFILFIKTGLRSESTEGRRITTIHSGLLFYLLPNKYKRFLNIIFLQTSKFKTEICL